MMKVCEHFPQLGRIVDYMTLPQGERVLYEQYMLDIMEEEAKKPVLKIDTRGGGRK